MSSYDDDLLDVAGRLVRRQSGQRGKLPAAQVRRSVSTVYYALFHFLTEDAATRLIGSGNALRRRRRILARTFTHKGLKAALSKVQGAHVDLSVEEFLNGSSSHQAPVVSPRFVQDIARAFAESQAKRHDADYDMNKNFSASDARLLRARAQRAIAGWRAVTSPSDRDFKHALSVLMLLRGQLRRDD